MLLVQGIQRLAPRFRPFCGLVRLLHRLFVLFEQLLRILDHAAVGFEFAQAVEHLLQLVGDGLLVFLGLGQRKLGRFFARFGRRGCRWSLGFGSLLARFTRSFVPLGRLSLLALTFFVIPAVVACLGRTLRLFRGFRFCIGGFRGGRRRRAFLRLAI